MTSASAAKPYWRRPARAIVMKVVRSQTGLGLMLALTLLPVLLEPFLRNTAVPSSSPGVALHLAGDAAYAALPSRFWVTLAAILTFAWALLALAGRKLETAWREDSSQTVTAADDAPIISAPTAALSALPGDAGSRASM